MKPLFPCAISLLLGSAAVLSAQEAPQHVHASEGAEGAEAQGGKEPPPPVEEDSAPVEVEAAEAPRESKSPATVDEALARLVQNIKAENAAKDVPVSSTQASLLSALQTQLQAEQLQLLHQTLGSLASGFPSHWEEIARLREMLDELHAREQAEDIARLEAAFKELADVLLSAKKPEELDPWIGRLGDLSAEAAHYNRYGSSSALVAKNAAELGKLRNYLSPATSVVTTWQDYLMAVKNRDVETARRSMGSLTSRISQFPYVLRSRVLEINAGLKGPNPFQPGGGGIPSREDYIARLKTPADVHVLKGEIASLNSSDRARLGLNTLYNELSRFQDGLNYISRGSYSSAVTYLRDLQAAPYLRPLVDEVFLDSSRKLIGIPDKLKVKDGEASEDFVDRYLESIKGDEQKLWQTLKAAQDLAIGPRRTKIQEEVKVVEFFIAAKSYEEQKQFARAIVAYRQLIGSPSLYLSKDAAGKKMRALREAHPEAAQTADSMMTHNSSVRLSYDTRLTSGQKAAIAEEVDRILKERAKESSDDERADKEQQ